MIKFIVAALLCGFSCASVAADKPLFSATPTILVRSPNPTELAKFYEALGMHVHRRNEKTGSVIFHLEGAVGSLEIVKMDANTKPQLGKTSRTQQGVVAIFETDNQQDVIRRAKEAGATVIEKWDAADRPVSIYYIGDPENNILGFAPRHHNPNIKTP